MDSGCPEVPAGRSERDRRGWVLSPRERSLWCCAFLVQLCIFATLPFAGRLASVLDGWFPLEAVFLVAFLLLMAAVAWGALSRPVHGRNLWIIAGLLAALALLVTRSGIPLAERSHLIEYGLVAALIFHALEARRAAGGRVRWPAVLAVVGAATLGLLDEAIQAALPGRVFDVRDILFNGLAASMTVCLTKALRFLTSRGESSRPAS